MLFDIEIPINYTPGAYKIKKAKDLLEDTATRKNIDLSHDLSLLVNGIETLRHLDYNESPISTHSLDGIEYHNHVNQLKG